MPYNEWVIESVFGSPFSRVNTETHIYYPNITDVRVIVPNKVVEVTFKDGTKEKAVCREPDVFSLETAISICISKKIFGGTKKYNDIIRNGVKVYNDRLKIEAEEKEEIARMERRRAKREASKARRDKRRADEERERQINIQKEAYIRAIEELQRKGVNDNDLHG